MNLLQKTFQTVEKMSQDFKNLGKNIEFSFQIKKWQKETSGLGNWWELLGGLLHIIKLWEQQHNVGGGCNQAAGASHQAYWVVSEVVSIHLVPHNKWM